MVPMATNHWPLFDLRIVTEHLVLRPISDDDFDALIEAIDAGIHDPDQSPFLFQWADEEPVQRARNALQYWWGRRASWTPTDWALGFGVWLEGRLVGVHQQRCVPRRHVPHRLPRKRASPTHQPR